MANVELDYLLRLGASDGLPRSRSIEASRRPRLGPTMAFATGVFEVDTMANVELDYSIDQERAICPHGLFYLKYGFFSFFAFANHARAPPTRRDARRGRAPLLLFTSDETLQALTLTELPE